MNAIILAAGLGSRLKELTKNKHKALFAINGIPNIERTIIFLNEIGVKEIHIVTGYLSEQFDYLREKFDINIIQNDKYKEQNNLSSFSLALPYFGDSFVIDGDVVLIKNILQVPTSSVYFTTIRQNSDKKEWVIKAINNKVIGIEICNKQAPSLLGISFFTSKDANIIKNHIKSLPNNIFLDPKKYYDNAILEVINDIDMSFINIENNLVVEIDDINDIKELDKKLRAENEKNFNR